MASRFGGSCERLDFASSDEPRVRSQSVFVYRPASISSQSEVEDVRQARSRSVANVSNYEAKSALRGSAPNIGSTTSVKKAVSFSELVDVVKAIYYVEECAEKEAQEYDAPWTGPTNLNDNDDDDGEPENKPPPVSQPAKPAAAPAASALTKPDPSKMDLETLRAYVAQLRAQNAALKNKGNVASTDTASPPASPLDGPGNSSLRAMYRPSPTLQRRSLLTNKHAVLHEDVHQEEGGAAGSSEPTSTLEPPASEAANPGSEPPRSPTAMRRVARTLT
eukprot:Colp12_sorted_trinity150504_noHs@15439